MRAFQDVRRLSSTPGQTRCRANVVEGAPPLVPALGLAGAAHRDVAPLEVAAVGRPEPGDRLVGVGLPGESLAHLLDRPDVELALDPLGVGVERRAEAALGPAHLGERPVERLAGHRPEQRLARDLPAVQVGAREQGVVVEHLLEVGDEPVRVDRVAREAAADLVVHPARRHRAQRVGRHVELATAQQELERRGGRELRRLAEAAVRRVVLRAQSRHRVVEGARAHRPGGRLEVCRAAQPVGDPPAAVTDLLAPVAPRLGHRREDVAPAGHAHARVGREVGAGVERHLLGRQEHVQRPASGSGHRLAGVHVDRVEVGPLLAVELDADEELVHQRRGLGVLERLALHHVTPVARRVADRQQDRPLLVTRACRAPPRPTEYQSTGLSLCWRR